MNHLLTRREREVMELVRKGMTNKEIAGALFITPKTVQSHMLHIMSKLQAKSRYKALIAMDELGPPPSRPRRKR